MTVFNEIGCKMLDFIAEIPYNYRVRYFIWRRIEVVVTRTIRNRFVLNRARGFESHHLRQGSLEAFAPKEFFFLAER